MTDPTGGGQTSGLVLALDIGGTKLTGALVGPDGSPGPRRTTATPAAGPGGGDEVFAALRTVLDGLLADLLADTDGAPLLGVGIGSAGPVDTVAGTVSPVNIHAWRGFPLVARVAAHVPDVPVTLAVDGICFAVGEHWRGAGRDTRSMLGMVVSTGVGGGLILDGRLHTGHTGNAGHVGHSIVDFDGPECTCGSRGCVEVLASGPNLVRWARGQGWRPDGSPATGRELAADATAGDPLALAAFDRSGRAVAAAITSVAATCELDRVVIGGGLAKTGPLLLDPVRAALARYARLPFLSTVRVEVSALGDDAGLIGAAALITRPDRYPTTL
jgi:glucokinase